MNIIDATLRFIKNEAKEFGEIAYINLFGSYLYGLSSNKSDIDILGIYFVFPYHVINGKIKKYFSFSSKEENEKAKFWDFEIYIYNIFDFIKKLNEGDIKALNLFFSYTNKNSIIHIEKRYKQVLKFLLSQERLYINKNLKSYINYIIEELKKFNIRGSFEGSLNFLISFLEKYKDRKLKDVLNILKEKIKSYEKEKIKFLEDKLFFFGKYFLYTFENDYILDILYKWKENLKKKKEKKEENLQKRLYHAKRAIYEIKSILRRKKIIYPFKGKQQKKLLFLKENKNIKIKKELNLILREAEKLTKTLDFLPPALEEKDLLKICDNVYKIYFNFPLLSYTKRFLNIK